MAMKVPGSVDYYPILIQDLFWFHISFDPGIMVSWKKPEIYLPPDCIKNPWQLRMLLPGNPWHRMLQIAKDNQKIGIGFIDTGEDPLEPIVCIALQVPTGAIECTLNTEMDVRKNEN